MTRLSVAGALFLGLLLPLAARGETLYEKPPREVLEVMHAPLVPDAILNPTHDTFLLAQPVWFPPIADLAQPIKKLAGTRVVVKNRSLYAQSYWSAFDLVKVSDGSRIHVALPPGARAGYPDWSADGKRYAFTNVAADAVELWTGEANSSEVRRIEGVKLNPFFGSEVQWMPDQKTLLVRTVPRGQGKPPAEDSIPKGPDVQETKGEGKAASTYEIRDVLTSAHAEDLLDYYGATQLARVDVATGHTTRLGKPGLYLEASPSPDGHLLVVTLHRPFSWLTTYDHFAREADVWNKDGTLARHIASLPVAESVPIWGVPTGPREFQWRPTVPASLYWAEALDGGDWNQTGRPTGEAKAARDKVMTWKAPFDGEPAEAFYTYDRFTSLWWSENGQTVFVTDLDAIKHRTCGYFLYDIDHPGIWRDSSNPLGKMWDLSSDERYLNPGVPVFHVLPNGFAVVDQEKENTIWLRGQGASPDGDRPFLDKFDFRLRTKERLFRSDRTSYESFAGWTDRAKGEFLTRWETPADPPNYYIRTLGERTTITPVFENGSPVTTNSPPVVWMSTRGRQVTHIADPTPQLRGITKKLITYKRADGVDLSFTLYLPPGYKEGTRLPAVLNAYPLDYTDPKVAGQVTGSTQRFTTISWQHQLMFLLEGYAVIDNPSLPVVGDANKIYDSYMEQLVSGASAAVDAAVATGTVDRDRIGIMGHSHGGLMTVNLLTWSDLFRAGVARSGAYNRSLTAFGFQNERRTLWEAPEVYAKVSPFFHADKLKLPVLLIHGEADVNPGTVPLQSEKLFEAIRGNGGTARLVMLPYESHGYIAMESNETVLAEMIKWFDQYVKNAPARAGKQAEK